MRQRLHFAFELHFAAVTSSIMKFPNSSRSRVLLGLGAVLAFWALLTVGSLIIGLIQANSTLTRIENVFPDETKRPAPATDEEANGQNILFLGVDSMGQSSKGLDDIRGTRADSIMLVHLSANKKYVTIISIMRDTYIEIPNYGFNRINAALSLGGVPTMVATVESILDTRIDHVALIDFDGFEGLIDEIGGVELINSTSFSSTVSPRYEFPAGPITLTGAEALAYSRERKNLPRGDYQRAEHQRAVVLAILQKSLSSGLLSNPVAATNAFKAISPYLALDNGVDLGFALETAQILRNLPSDGVRTFTLQIGSSGFTESGMAVVYLEQDKLLKVKKRLANDTIHNYKKTPE
jgi:polyisoprenyl-teichoic acid--peptidoglycan teichoic acid transferase